MLKSTSESTPETGLSSAFIWYHADAKLAGQLSRWVHEISQQSGLVGRLLMRNESGKNTFMEIYPGADKTTIANIEKIAAKQHWFTQLGSPRQVEIFNEISR